MVKPQTYLQARERVKKAMAVPVRKRIDGKTYTLFGEYRTQDRADRWVEILQLCGWCARSNWNLIKNPKTNRLKSVYKVWFRKC